MINNFQIRGFRGPRDNDITIIIIIINIIRTYNLKGIIIASKPWPEESTDVKKCGTNCELAHQTSQQLYNFVTSCMDDHQFKEEENESVGELSTVCAQIFVKCLYLTRIERPDILWSVNKHARAVPRWTGACDKRLARLSSCIHHTSEYVQY